MKNVNFENAEKYIFFDAESKQETGTHEINIVICHDYNGNENIFKDENEFCDWLFIKNHFGYTVLAHCENGCDFQFQSKYCFSNKIKVFIIYQGSKPTYMQAS